MNYLNNLTIKHILCLILALGFSLGAYAAKSDGPSGLDAKSFKKYWHVESESPDYKVTFNGDTATIFAPKGLTLGATKR